MRALIVEDGFSRGALAAVRSLGRAGWYVGVASPHKGLAARSRWAAEWHEVPSTVYGEAFVVGVSRALAARSYEVLFPCGDPEVLALSEARAKLSATFPYPPHENVLRAHDKVQLAEAARLVGLRVPRAGQVSQLVPPLVVKPRLRAGTPLSPLVADDARAAREHVADLHAGGVESVVQEYVDGRLAALVVLVDGEGQIVAESYQIADAIWPPRAGGSVRAHTAAADPELRGGVESLIRELGWSGLAQVQFILPQGGEPVLLDVNGRFYGSLALAIRAGVDFPDLWGRLALGRSFPPTTPARARVRYHALEGDLRRAAKTQRPAGTVASCVRYAFGATHGIWRITDPLPALLQTGRLAVRALRRIKYAGRG